MSGAPLEAFTRQTRTGFEMGLEYAAAGDAADIPILPHLLDPERWLLWLALLFLLLLCCFRPGLREP